MTTEQTVTVDTTTRLVQRVCSAIGLPMPELIKAEPRGDGRYSLNLTFKFHRRSGAAPSVYHILSLEDCSEPTEGTEPVPKLEVQVADWLIGVLSNEILVAIENIYSPTERKNP